MDGVKQQDSTPQNDSTLGFKWIKKYVVHPLSNGCLPKQFLETEVVIDLLTTYKYSESHNKIPEGTKSDVFVSERRRLCL
jgi:hypothetical protein